MVADAPRDTCQTLGCQEPAEDFELWLANIDGGIYWPAESCYEHLAPMYQQQLREFVATRKDQ